MKSLILIRHAKASWKATDQTDLDRPLTKRGKSDAALMGRLLQDRDIVPDLILSSPARRAVSTAHMVSEAVHYPTPSIRTNPLIYDGTLGEHISILNKLEDLFESIIWIGHNPTLTLMVRWLLGRAVTSVPPGGVISVQFDAEDWGLIEEGSGSMQFYESPNTHDEGIH